jgi:hypothetical protein
MDEFAIKGFLKPSTSASRFVVIVPSASRLCVVLIWMLQ